VELYGAPQNGGRAFSREMLPAQHQLQQCGTYLYAASIPANRPAEDFTPRVLPYHELALPTEIRRIVWQR
jgi:starch phosphorylase